MLDRSFLLPLNRSEVPPIVLVLELVLVLGFSWVGAKISKIENPQPPCQSPLGLTGSVNRLRINPTNQ